MSKKTALLAFLALGLIFAANGARADEGMWLYTNPPVKQMKEKYGVDITPEQLEHLQKSCLRFATYGSASFVSADGLILTNHHVGLRTVSSLSTKENNLVEKGFKAEKFEDELKCPGLQLVLLQEIVDVTAQVEESVANAKNEEESNAARVAKIKEIEEAANKEKGLSCKVIALYQGGLYHLYCYKEFNDVRLVFAPEESIGFFGGDPDNFEYPRYNLDITLFRAYENDKPYRPEHYLKWSEKGAMDGDFVLVSGYPARTNRFNTIADLEYQRDVYYPHMMSKYRRRETAYNVYKSIGAENARRIATDLFGIQNSRKNRGGILQGLQTETLMKPKTDAENELRKLAKERGTIDFSQGDPWDKIASAISEWSTVYVAFDLLEANEAFFGSKQIGRAKAIVRYVEEAAKPEEEREEAYKGEGLEKRKNELLSDDSSEYDEINVLKLGDSLSMLYELSRPCDGGRAIGSVVVPTAAFETIYGGVSPKARAIQILKNSKVLNKEFVQQVIDGGVDALEKSDDPAIQIAFAIEPICSNLRRFNKKVEEIKRIEYAKIAKARFAIYGDAVYPDATFTMRLTYGKACGYKTDEGADVPYATNVAGAYEHAAEHNYEDPYDLSESWRKANQEGRAPKESLLNFVTTNDIIGGNSGSPAVNAKGEIIGLIFDGNVQSLIGNFAYEDVQMRAVLVHSQAIRDVLRDVYQLPQLADELGR
ncbi:MAG: S46 family peptidase [Thermoguttaceae bacterium]|nr:S46 family peptidase [Thermoguttaceae bacterium]